MWKPVKLDHDDGRIHIVLSTPDVVSAVEWLLMMGMEYARNM
jgi:hypothetical protein